MHNFTGQMNQVMQNGFSHFIFLHSGYFQPTLPIYPFNQSFQLQDRKGSAVFPIQNSSFPPTVTQNIEEEPQIEVLHKSREKKLKKEKKVRSDVEDEEQEEQFKIKASKVRLASSGSYKKKNTESNIVNQTFSYLSSDKSQKLVKQYFKDHQENYDDFYKVMIKIKQGNKKYINRFYLKRLLAFQEKSEFERAFIKAKPKNLTLENMRSAVRTLLFNFLRENLSLSVLTSCKIYKETLPEHFWRRREVLKFLFFDNSSEES